MLYISEDQSQLEEDYIKLELELMVEPRSLFKKLNIPNSPRNCDVVYKRRSWNPFSDSEINDEPPLDKRSKKKMMAVNVIIWYGMRKIFQRLISQKISAIKSTKGPATDVFNRFPKIYHIKVIQQDDLVQSQEIDIRRM